MAITSEQSIKYSFENMHANCVAIESYYAYIHYRGTCTWSALSPYTTASAKLCIVHARRATLSLDPATCSYSMKYAFEYQISIRTHF